MTEDQPTAVVSGSNQRTNRALAIIPSKISKTVNGKVCPFLSERVSPLDYRNAIIETALSDHGARKIRGVIPISVGLGISVV